MPKKQHTITAKVWMYQGDSPWHFITIDQPESRILESEYIWPRRGFGSIPVSATVGDTEWRTSIFPDKFGTYLLPIKKSVRTDEDIHNGDTVSVNLCVIS